ncbi:MAG: carboxypeptidase-like regulatory domain-containing protein [Chitinophagaceae bacterium]|nr:MAG: carboxypeptidase-like regulatory domain-containing protein [Chitinophagaceae bacterium]
MRFRFLLFLFLLPFLAAAQRQLQGTVTDAGTGKPVSGASVFLSNTSVGTTAGTDGHFTLAIPAGRYDLIASSVGYETHSQTVTGSGAAETISIRLNPKAEELQNVVIRSMEKDGWQRWGSFFIKGFIGTSAEAERCTLKNPKALRFYRDKKANQLEIVATEPLVIENRALGYRIRYQLESYTYDFNSRVQQYVGYPLFEPLDGGSGRQRRWAGARSKVYYGSQMHFMRALFRNRLQEEGFTVLPQRKIPNLKRVRRTERIGNSTLIELDNGLRIKSDVPADTIRAYQAYVGNDAILNLVGGNALPGDSIAYAIDPHTAGLFFSDYLTVIYAAGKTPAAYQHSVMNGNYAMQSEITLINGTPVQVEANGVYYNPLDLMSNGWWAWSEKVGTMLPFDYKPE